MIVKTLFQTRIKLNENTDIHKSDSGKDNYILFTFIKKIYQLYYFKIFKKNQTKFKKLCDE